MLKSRFKQTLLIPCLLVALVGGMVGATVPQDSASAACGRFLTFPAWYQGLTRGSDCELRSVGEGPGEVTLTNYVWTIVLNVIEILLQIVGYAAVLMIIYAGFLYLTSGGNPQGMANALKTIINASIGLVIAISAITIKNFIWELFTGGTNSEGIYTGINMQTLLTSGLQKVYFIAGAAAVLVIIISGIRFVTSAGGSDGVAKARRMIVGAVIGLVVIIAASVITRFVMGYFI